MTSSFRASRWQRIAAISPSRPGWCHGVRGSGGADFIAGGDASRPNVPILEGKQEGATVSDVWWWKRRNFGAKSTTRVRST